MRVIGVVLSRLTATAWFGVLVLIALTAVTHLPALQLSDIDTDESTFMIVAQSTLRGDLPYITAFDNKPPGLFLILAGVMAMLGESHLVVRLFGAACIAGAASLVLLTCRQLAGSGLALALAGTYVVAHVVLAQSTSSEVIANVFLAGSLYAFVRFACQNRASFVAGLLVGGAVLTRTNLAYLALALAILHAYAIFWPQRVGLKRSSILALGLGGLVPLVMVVSAYAAQGQLPLLWVSAVEVALSQSSGRTLWYNVIVVVPLLILRVLPSFAAPLLVLGGIGAVIAVRRRATGPIRRNLIFLATYIVSIAISISLSGTFFNHYMVQLFSPLAAAGAIGLSGAGSRVSTLSTRLAQFAGVVAVVWALLHAPSPDQLIGSKSQPEAQAAAAIAADRRPGDRVWALGEQLVLFYLDERPILPIAAFPKNIGRPLMYAPLARAGFLPAVPIAAIAGSHPAYLVMGPNGAIGPELEAEGLLSTEYEDWYRSEEVVVLRRRRG